MGSSGKNPPANAGDIKDSGSVPGVERFPGEGNDNPRLSLFLPGKSLGQRSLASYSSRGHKESDTAERKDTHRHFLG